MKRYPWIIPMIIAAIMLVGGARMHGLWGDESETALFAKNVLKYGVPKGWDGTNIMGINNGVVLNENLINHTSPWAQYYLVAASFAVFGQSSFTARIPSIILSILSIPLIYYLAKRISGKKRVGLIAAIIASCSVQGILFGFQARYYELTTVCGLLFVWAALSLMDGGFWPSLLFILSGTVFFYANYVAWSAFYAASLIVSGLFIWNIHGKLTLKRYIRRFLLLTIPIIAICLPWYLLMHPFGSRGFIAIFPISNTILGLWFLSKSAWGALEMSGILPIGLVGILILVLYLKRPTLSRFRPLLFFVLLPTTFLIIMTIFATIAYVDTTLSSSRYTTAALPWFFIGIAALFDEVFIWKRWVGIVILTLYLVQINLFSFHRPRSLLWDYVSEMIHPYQTPELVVANFLKTHAKKGQTAFVNLDHDHEPLIFLLGDTNALKFVNRVDFLNSNIFPKNRLVIPRYIYDFRVEPDWLIMYSKRGADGTFFTQDWRTLWPEVDIEGDYIEHTLPIYFSDNSRPEIELRSFYSAFNPSPRDYVYIYEKKK